MGQPDMQTFHSSPRILRALIHVLCDTLTKMRWHTIMEILVLWEVPLCHWVYYVDIQQYSVISQKS